MAEYLVYRFPGESIQLFRGKWHSASWEAIADIANAFVFSDANGENLRVFESFESISPDQIQFSFPQDTNQPIISKEEYLFQLTNLMDAMCQQGVGKVVYSRINRKNWESGEGMTLFHNLAVAYPQTLVYLIVSELDGCWMGATPEILIAGNDELYHSMALAGTLGIEEPSASWGEKEYEEQAYVTSFIQDAIHQHGKLIQESTVYERQAGPVKHLCTDFKFTLPNAHIIPFIQTIHPTPAVCGIPVAEAAKLYATHELHERRIYTGLIGRVDAKKLNLFVNLRCMQCTDKYVDLFVGGGITKDSVPISEWNETERKSSTLSHYLTK